MEKTHKNFHHQKIELLQNCSIMNDDELGFASYFIKQTYNDTNKY